jgi:hypothetical protein
MKKRHVTRLIIVTIFFAFLSGAVSIAENTEARIIKASNELFHPATSKEKLVDDACTSVRQSQDGKAAKLILELVLMIVTPVSG